MSVDLHFVCLNVCSNVCTQDILHNEPITYNRHVCRIKNASRMRYLASRKGNRVKMRF